MSAAPPIDRQHAVSFQHVLDADKSRRSIIVGKAIVDYLADRPEKNFVDVEAKLRTNNCFTRLIAAKSNTPGHTPTLHQKTRTYELFISTRDPEQSLADLIERVDNEETNLLRLADTGILCADVRKDKTESKDLVLEIRPGIFLGSPQHFRDVFSRPLPEECTHQ
jgi:hypothetical protein